VRESDAAAHVITIHWSSCEPEVRFVMITCIRDTDFKLIILTDEVSCGARQPQSPLAESMTYSCPIVLSRDIQVAAVFDAVR
jgi:hypothetical protein